MKRNCLTKQCSCVPSNFMTNRRVPKFSLNNCAQSSKKMFMCPKFCTNPVLNYTKCHLSTNLSNFLKLCLLLYIAKNYLPLLQQIADSLKKIGLVGTLQCSMVLHLGNKATSTKKVGIHNQWTFALRPN